MHIAQGANSRKGEQGFALPVVSAFEALNTPRTERILIRNPGNPTGYMISRSELESLRSIVRKHDLYHFADVTTTRSSTLSLFLST